MVPLAITATGVVSALGPGVAATRAALRARRSGLVACGPPHAAVPGFVGAVAAVEAHALPAEVGRFDCRNNRLADMALDTDGFRPGVAAARERYGAARIAVVVGTSTSGVGACEAAYRARDPAGGALPAGFDYDHTHDMFSLARFVRAALELRGPALTLSTACASSARSFLDAARLIAAGFADAAVVGGADSLCAMTLHGFAALELIDPAPCRPCAADRAGTSLGEAAGFALRGALAGAGVAAGTVDYVNLHGTGTRANDAMEDRAVFEVFGAGVACSSTKGFTGHTLGACGVVEAVVAGVCLRDGFMPGCLGVAAVDPGFASRVLVDNAEAPVRLVMSNAFGFGGINCSLLFGRA